MWGVGGRSWFPKISFNIFSSCSLSNRRLSCSNCACFIWNSTSLWCLASSALRYLLIKVQHCRDYHALTLFGNKIENFFKSPPTHSGNWHIPLSIPLVTVAWYSGMHTVNKSENNCPKKLSTPFCFFFRYQSKSLREHLHAFFYVGSLPLPSSSSSITVIIRGHYNLGH